MSDDTPESLRENAARIRNGKSPLFTTFDSMDELQAYVDRFSGGERSVANLVMAITYNTTLELVAQAFDKVAEREENSDAAEQQAPS